VQHNQQTYKDLQSLDYSDKVRAREMDLGKLGYVLYLI